MLPQRGTVIVGVVALSVCAICLSVNDWLLAPPLAILAALLWQTRHDPYAGIPGFSVGFVIGVVMSSGVGPAAAVDCGLYGGAMGAPLNALCRGFWLVGAAALVAILASFVTMQAIMLLLS